MDAEKTTNSFVILLKSLLLVFLLTTLGCEMPKENPPNVLLIMIDDLNDCIETLKGHPQNLTPNMRKLALSGVAFLNAHTNAPMCGPSRSSMMMGVYPHHSQNFFQAPWFNNPVLKNTRTLSEQFRKAGYQTLGTGKVLHHLKTENWDHYENPPDYGPIVWDGNNRLAHPDIPRPFYDIGPVDGSLGNAEKGLFADALLEKGISYKYSEHANGMALALKIADEDQGKSIVEKLLNDDPNLFIKRTNGMTIVTPALSYFLHKGLAQYGHVDASFDLLRRRFDHMLAPEHNGTLWEEWWLDGTGRNGKLDNRVTRSDAQTESAFIPALFAEFLLGLEPSQPGMTEITIALPQTKIKKIASVFPTPMGSINLKWDLNEKSKRVLQLQIPKGIKVILEKDSFGMPKEGSIKVNGKKTSFQSIKALRSGSWELIF